MYDTPGNCYEDSLQLLIANDYIDYLVHGYPYLNCGKNKDKQYGHAWLEYEFLDMWWVLDHLHQEEPVPRIIYYHAGRVKEMECDRYTRDEAMGVALDTEHSGPWRPWPKAVNWVLGEFAEIKFG